jgi:hypothetical protein
MLSQRLHSLLERRLKKGVARLETRLAALERDHGIVCSVSVANTAQLGTLNDEKHRRPIRSTAHGPRN